ncbi:MAG: hypothetical protein HONBIEJF_01823 [Fimbriimonadaceae bacterium]|nr:hypothetical protein [Fimbriimonadaceae bacterium]
MELWLSGPGTSAAQILEDGSRPLPGNGWNRIVVIVSEMESMIEQARAAGATLRNGPISGPGGAQALIADPSGNVIELFQPKAE